MFKKIITSQTIAPLQTQRVWLDDLRPTPAGYTHTCRTAKEAIALLSNKQVEFISLDHDLGPPEAGTGYEVATFIERAAYFNEIPPLKWQIHSANSVGIMKMKVALDNADKFFESHINKDNNPQQELQL